MPRIRINDVAELRGALGEHGYGEFLIQHPKGPESFEIDYVPKSDKFLIQHLDDGSLQRLSVTELYKLSNIGTAMIDGLFFQVKD